MCYDTTLALNGRCLWGKQKRPLSSIKSLPKKKSGAYECWKFKDIMSYFNLAQIIAIIIITGMIFPYLHIIVAGNISFLCHFPSQKLPEVHNVLLSCFSVQIWGNRCLPKRKAHNLEDGSAWLSEHELKSTWQWDKSGFQKGGGRVGIVSQ